MNENIDYNSEQSYSFSKTKQLLLVDILLAVLTVLLTISYYIYDAVSAYNIGANPLSDRWIMEKILIALLLYFVFSILLFLGQIAVIIIMLVLRLTRQWMAGILLFIVCIVVVCVAYKTNKPGIYYIFQGHTDRIKRDVDFKLIRDWSNTADISKQDDYGMPKECWPIFIKQLKAHTVFVEKKETIGTVVKFEWGIGPFVHWGLVVGPTDMEVPESINKSDLNPVGEYRVKIAPGAYVWHDVK
jgi:hypothetical protein